LKKNSIKPGNYDKTTTAVVDLNTIVVAAAVMLLLMLWLVFDI